MKRLLDLLLCAVLCLSACADNVSPPLVQNEGGTKIENEGADVLPYQPPEPVYERWYEEYTDHLIPDENYGLLYPFAGQVREDTFWGDIVTYGLMTQEGKLVVDPAYQSVQRLSYYDQFAGTDTQLPVLLLRLAQKNADAAPTYVAAAQDGSWVIEGTYISGTAISPETFLLQDEEGIYYTFDSDGNQLTAFLMHDKDGYFENWWNGVGVFCNYNTNSFALVNALSVTITRLEEIDSVGWGFGGGLLPAHSEEGLWGYLDHNGNWVFQPTFERAAAFQYGFAEVATGDGQRLVIDTQGKILAMPGENSYLEVAPLSDGSRVILQGEYSDDGFCIQRAYNEDWTIYDGLQAGDVVEIYSEGILRRLGNGRLQWAGEDRTFSLSADATSMPVIVGDCLCLYEGTTAALLDRHGRELIAAGICGSFYTLQDEYTGETYILGEPPYDQNQVWYLCDREGNILLTLLNDKDFYDVDIRDGMVQYRSGDMVTIMNLASEVIFRYPITTVTD